jgi:hypothetical protein
MSEALLLCPLNFHDVNFSYVTERSEGKMERAGGARQQSVCLSMASVTENVFSPFNFNTIGGILIH